MTTDNALRILAAGVITLSALLSAAIVSRGAEIDRNQACVAALNDHKDTLRVMAQALGQHPDQTPSRPIGEITAALKQHDEQCRG